MEVVPVGGSGGVCRVRVPSSCFFEGVHGQGRAGDVAGLGFERLYLTSFDGRSGKDRKAGMSPRKEVLDKVFGKALGLMETLQKETPEELHDSRRIERRKRQELALGGGDGTPFREEGVFSHPHPKNPGTTGLHCGHAQ